MPAKNDSPPDGLDSQRSSFLLQVGRYSQLAFVLPAATFVGWLFGALLDHWLHTSWIYIAGLLLGIVAGFVQLIRSVLASESK